MKPVEVEILMRGSFLRDIERAKKGVMSFEDVVRKAGSTIGIAFGVSQLKDFVQKVVQVRGEVEQLQISLKTLAGEKAGEQLYQDMHDFVVKTPMLMSQVAQGAQTLLSFNIEAGKVMPILRQIGDISMGDAQKFQSLTLAFAQMSSTGKLMGQDLLQMINAGFNPLVVMSEQTGKSISQLKDEMQKGQISVEQVEDAFRRATSEGGLFHGMLEKQSQGISGQLSNLQGAIEDMFNEIGSRSEGVVGDVISGGTTLVKHYEDIAKILGVVIAAYGTYRGALLLVSAAEKAWSALKTAQAFVGLAGDVKSARDAMLLFNVATKANPLLALVGVVMGAVTAFHLFGDSTDTGTEASKRFTDAMMKETATVKALYATLSMSSSQSKLATDSARELKGVAEEYGIQLSETATQLGHESELISELTSKREELISAIEREAVAREQAAYSKELEETYAEKLTEAREQFKQALGDDFSDAAKIQLSNLIRQEDIDRVAALKQELEEAAQGGTWTTRYTAAWEAYEEEITALKGRLWEYLTVLEQVEGEEGKYEDSSLKVRDAIWSLMNATGGATQELNASKEALARATLAQSEQISVQDAASASASSLHSTTQALVDLWNTSHPEMTFKIHYDDSEIPGWMKGMTTEQLKRSLAVRQAALRNANAQEFRQGGTVKTRGQIVREAAMMDSLVSGRERPAGGNRPVGGRSGKSGSRGSGFDPENARAEARQRLTDFADDLRDYTEKLIRRNEQSATSLLSESTDKAIAELNHEMQEKRAALDAEIDRLVDQAKKVDKENFLKGGTDGKKHTEKEWVAKSDSAYRQEVLSRELTDAAGNSLGTLGEAYEEQLDLLSQQADKALKEIYRSELQSMYDYLKEYGTLEEQRYATEQEWAEKRRKAKNEGERKAAEAGLKAALSGLDIKDLKSRIDWYGLFSGYKGMLSSQIREELDNVEKIIKDKSFADMDASSQKDIIESYNALRELIGTSFNTIPFEEIGSLLNELEAKQRELKGAKAAEKEALERLTEAEKTYESFTGSAADKAKLKKGVDMLRERASAFSSTVKQLETDTRLLGNEVGKVRENVKTAMQNAIDGLNMLKSGNLSGIFEGAKKLYSSFAKADKDGKVKGLDEEMKERVDSFFKELSRKDGLAGQIGKAMGDFLSPFGGEIIGMGMELLDILGAGVENLVTNVVEVVLKALAGIIRTLIDPRVWVQTVGVALRDGFREIGNVLTFGGLDHWLDTGNGKEVARITARLTASNERLKESVDRLKERMDGAVGAQAIGYYKEALSAQERLTAQKLELLQAQMGYHGAHHSNARNFNLAGEDYDLLNALLGTSAGSLEDLYRLTPEQMDELRSRLPDVWQHILSQGKYDKSEWWDSYADEAGKAAELSASLRETLTGTTQESVFDDFLGSLYDLADGSEDVMEEIADNWQKMVNRMAVNNLVGAKFQKNLEDWYENLAKLNEARTNGEITDEEYRKRLDALKAEYEGYVERAKRDIETLRTEGIVKATEENSGVTQSGRSGAFTTMSQDQAGKLEGLFVSGQMHWASMDDKLTDVTRQMDEAGDTLRKIATNTGSSAQSLGEIKEDIKKMIRDGVKVR